MAGIRIEGVDASGEQHDLTSRPLPPEVRQRLIAELLAEVQTTGAGPPLVAQLEEALRSRRTAVLVDGRIALLVIPSGDDSSLVVRRLDEETAVVRARPGYFREALTLDAAPDVAAIFAALRTIDPQSVPDGPLRDLLLRAAGRTSPPLSVRRPTDDATETPTTVTINLQSAAHGTALRARIQAVVGELNADLERVVLTFQRRADGGLTATVQLDTAGAFYPMDGRSGTALRLLEIVAPLITRSDRATNRPLLLALQAAEYERRLREGPDVSDPALAVIQRAARVTQARFDEVAAPIAEELGVRPRRWLGWMNDPREVEVVRAVQRAAASQQGLSPSFLYTVAIGEGLNGWLDRTTTTLTLGPRDDEIDGFSSLGTDVFGSEAERLRERGLLPADFVEGLQYTLVRRENERREQVTSAIFHPTPPSATALENGLIALAATVAEHQRRVRASAAEILGAQRTARLTPTELGALTYYSFNAGHNAARRHLRQIAAGQRVVPRHTQVDSGGSSASVSYNTTLRVATWRLIDQLGLFAPPTSGSR